VCVIDRRPGGEERDGFVGHTRHKSSNVDELVDGIVAMCRTVNASHV
jgi:hypothetical protein